MTQDKIFLKKEGDAWFLRNKEELGCAKYDRPSRLAKSLNKEKIKSIAELGCSNGWRLHYLGREFQVSRLVGVDASKKAITDGKKRYPELDLRQGLLHAVPLSEAFDLVIVNFVFHWVDRTTLARSVAEVDRVVNDGGYLIIGDFLPRVRQKRRYHHLPEKAVYTYKQDYARIFESLGIYKEIRRMIYNHDDPKARLGPYASSKQAVSTILKKSYAGYYREG